MPEGESGRRRGAGRFVPGQGGGLPFRHHRQAAEPGTLDSLTPGDDPIAGSTSTVPEGRYAAQRHRDSESVRRQVHGGTRLTPAERSEVLRMAQDSRARSRRPPVTSRPRPRLRRSRELGRYGAIARSRGRRAGALARPMRRKGPFGLGRTNLALSSGQLSFSGSLERKICEKRH